MCLLTSLYSLPSAAKSLPRFSPLPSILTFSSSLSSRLIHISHPDQMTSINDNEDGQVQIHSRRPQKTQAELEKEKWQEAHRLACEGNRKKYIDPKTGYSVMTELLHKRRGYCCGNACRHCPYDNENVGVSPEIKKANIERGKQQRKAIEAIEGKPVWADEEEDSYSD